jgi:uridine phosphorylase
MPFPRHPGKHARPGVVTARGFVRYLRTTRSAVPRVPSTVVLGFAPRLARVATEELGARRVHGYPRLHAVGRGSRTIGYLEPRGVGGPATAIAVEELAALGTRRFVIVGFAGALDPLLALGSTVLCRRAIRDEGTSHHYARPATWAYPDRALSRRLGDLLAAEGHPARVGDSWTIDAPYRETAAEVRRYRREGVLSVEMEASALFTVARVREVESAALFTISDHVGARRWRPGFAEAIRSLERLFALTVRGLGRLPPPSSAPSGRSTGPSKSKVQ